MADKKDGKPRVGRPPEWEWPRIDATPEELARAILTQPPRKPHEWPYMQERAAKRQLNEQEHTPRPPRPAPTKTEKAAPSEPPPPETRTETPKPSEQPPPPLIPDKRPGRTSEE